MKTKGKVILCHDCRKYGYVVYQPWGEMVLLPGWKAVRVRWKWVYICDECQQRRRREVKELLARNKGTIRKGGAVRRNGYGSEKL